VSYDEKTGHCFCERCGYDWTVRQKFNGNNYYRIEPRSCAKCKSKVWNHPRVYAGKYVSGTLAKRFKPTGRAAARQRIDTNQTKQEKLNAILNELSPEERCAAEKIIIIHELAAMLEELGLR